jgi:hypothetical protein
MAAGDKLAHHHLAVNEVLGTAETYESYFQAVIGLLERSLLGYHAIAKDLSAKHIQLCPRVAQGARWHPGFGAKRVEKFCCTPLPVASRLWQQDGGKTA